MYDLLMQLGHQFEVPKMCTCVLFLLNVWTKLFVLYALFCACQLNVNSERTMLACLALLHGVLLLCMWLANDQPLLSSQAVWTEYELIHCNMTGIIPVGEPAALRRSFSFSCESKVSKLPPLCLIIWSPFSPSSTFFFSTAAFVFSVIQPSTKRQTFPWGSLSLTSL